MKVHHEIKIRFFAVFLHLFRRIGDGVNHLKKEMSSTEGDIVCFQGKAYRENTIRERISVSVPIIAALFSVLLSPIDCSLRNMGVVEI